MVVGEAGIEPTTPGLEGRWAIRMKNWESNRVRNAAAHYQLACAASLGSISNVAILTSPLESSM
jgi:hypothetical protein